MPDWRTIQVPEQEEGYPDGSGAKNKEDMGRA
jgi:hypothetical protein